jgi:site-specific DNA-cytosine methylase
MKKRVLVACEYSGLVRDAFSALGWEAISCDLLPSDTEGLHFQGDVRELLTQHWDLIIAFPPCTHLAVSGARWFKEKQADGRQQEGIDFFMLFVNAKCKYVAIENPIGIMSTKYRKPDQIIQPWQFGHGETKATCLWLKNLPNLTPTKIVEGREQRIWKLPPSPDRAKIRSKTYEGIAKAMADQWGKLLLTDYYQIVDQVQ